MAIVPILIIPPTLIIYKQKITWKEIAGAILSVAGIALLFI
jgi:drug/metabolite transporter (DMT)-like permease